ncbi:MAG: BMP family ABC transporter substrate-binding protein [Oscillospiraceae bacterium]|nr:BMP family ABC transporter substrate-binding protein [Oscillospiraceae bacterium]
MKHRTAKLLALSLALLLGLSALAACGKTDPETPTTTAPPTTEKVKTPVLSPATAKIALLLCDAEMKSGSARAAWTVLEKFSKETGIALKWWMLPTSQDIQNELDGIVADGYNIIVTNNGMHCAYIKERCKALKDVTFVAMEGFFGKKGEDLSGYPNLIQGTVRAEESAFIAGYLLAKKTETGRIGLLNGTKNPPGIQMEAGFTAGVEYAAKEMQRVIEMRVEYAGNGYNRTKGQDTARLLYNSGCDIIYCSAGGETDWGALEIAKELNKPVVTAGHTSYIAPGSVVAEVLKSKDPVLTEIINGLYYGTMKGGQILDHGLTDGTAGFAKTALTDEFFGAEILAQLDAVIEKIKNNEIVIPQAI